MRFLFIILIIVGFSCVKDKSCEGCPGPFKEANATVHWTGPIAGDGCDWVIFIDSSNKQYHPDNLKASYQQDNLKVKIKYRVTSEHFGCGFGNSQMEVIHLYKVTL